MCGIAGIIYFDQSRIVEPGILKKMSDTVLHRGPDDEGFYFYKNIGLGFRRLSIIDLTTGKQPISNEDETVWVIMNGEIYNYKKLRTDLISKGHKFKSKSDTEVLVHLYEENGIDFIAKLRGMFSIALYDKTKNRLILVRDRVGIKPLYYALNENSFIFGSELKEIIKVIEKKPEINSQAILDYFTYGYILGAKTIFKGINKLLPSTYLVLNLNTRKTEITQYWKIDATPDYSKTESEWTEIIRGKLSETIESHMISDVPLGAFLSGGVDSSAVVATMAMISSHPIKTFTIGFKEAKYNELEYARKVSKQYNTDHNELILEPSSVDIIEELIKIFDEPFADSSAIPTYLVSKFTRKYVTVALSGDGGDELFAGYSFYAKAKQIANMQLFLPNFTRQIFNLVNKTIPDYMYGKGLSYYLSKSPHILGAYYSLFKDYEISKLFENSFIQEIRPYSAIEVKKNMLNSFDTQDIVTQNELLDINFYMVDDILTKVDRTSMANSLEVRVPLLDHEFMELAFKIPSNLKLKENEGKYIFKKSLQSKLPNEILYRKKQGFAIPLDIWFKGDLKEYAFDNLNKSQYLSAYLNQDYVNKILANHQKGLRDYSQKIWSLIILNEWLKKYSN